MREHVEGDELDYSIDPSVTKANAEPYRGKLGTRLKELHLRSLLDAAAEENDYSVLTRSQWTGQRRLSSHQRSARLVPLRVPPSVVSSAMPHSLQRTSQRLRQTSQRFWSRRHS